MKKYILMLLAAAGISAASAQKVTLLNRHTVQVQLKSGQMMYLDFYGNNIFRLFQDPAGGELRDPAAQPAAQILVDNPRREVSLSLQGNMVQTPALFLTVKAGGQLEVKHREGSLSRQAGEQQRVLEIRPAEFKKGKTQLTLSKEAKDHFYGGGCQNGRFSHQGQRIAIVNTNNWVDGGVASPAPFYWSTSGYGVMGYTFTPGQYDFAQEGQVTLMHETSYLDYFFMFNPYSLGLLNDYYQLTGNPVLLPKFGFYEGHLNAYNRDYWTEKEDSCSMRTASATTRARRTTGAYARA